MRWSSCAHSISLPVIQPKTAPVSEPGRDAFAPSAETVYVRFESHYVAVELGIPQLAASFRASIGQLLAATPHGISAGSLKASLENGRIRIVGPAALGVEQFTDPTLAARGLLHGVVKLLMTARPDLLWIHGGVAAHDGRALLLPATSGNGKSTLIAELLKYGWIYLSDEVAPIDPVTCRVFPFPVTPHMRIGHQPNLSPAEVRKLAKIRIDIGKEMVGAVAVPLERIYFLSYQQLAVSVQTVVSSPGQSVVEMLRHSLSAWESRDAEICGLCELMRQVPGVHLRYANAHDAAAELAHAHQRVKRQSGATAEFS
jgi:hypothetical protein